MFKFLKKKKEDYEILSPFNGEVIELEKIPDPVFAERMMGDGVGVIPVEGNLYAPFDGEVVQVFETKHAIILKDKDGTCILIHIGLDTVQLNGEPYDVKVNTGDKISKGDLLVIVDLDFIKSKELEIITPIILINEAEVETRSIVSKNTGTTVKVCEYLFKVSKN